MKNPTLKLLDHHQHWVLKQLIYKLKLEEGFKYHVLVNANFWNRECNFPQNIPLLHDLILLNLNF